MAVRVTCKSKRDPEPLAWTYTGPLPEYVIEVDDVALAWLGAVREGYALVAKQAGWMEGRTFPLPDGPRWSERGIVPDSMPYPSEVWYSVTAWERRLPGARCALKLETMDAGFDVTWTFEIV